jgi:hypothetical protein
MKRRLSAFMLLLSGCELFVTDNPSNCARVANLCSAAEYCDAVTQRCQTLDCTVNTTLCEQTEYCSSTTHRCIPKDCVVEPSLCASDQQCNEASRRCETLTFVLGQPDEESCLAQAYGMNHPEMLRLLPDPVDATKARLLVADTQNRRVLVWNSLPTSNRPADVVFGAPDVHTRLVHGPYSGVNEASIGSAWGMSSDGVRLAVGDAALNRVLLWNTIPTQMPKRGPIPANRVWGQNSFLTSATDNGSSDPTALGIRAAKVFLDRTPSTEFYITDSQNNRVLVFNNVPGGPAVAPSLVVGQAAFNTIAPACTATGLYGPRDVTRDTNFLWVSDTACHRVLGYPLPIAGNAPAATVVIGQGGNFSSGIPNFGGLAAPGLYVPNSISASKSPRLLFIADGANHRVLRFSLATSLTVPDLVLGQPNFSSGLPNRGVEPGLNTFANPAGVDTDGVHLAVSDFSNNRVLLWNTIPTSNGQPADVVLGQPDPVSNTVNTLPTKGPLQFRQPRNATSDGPRLFVSDGSNHRVLIWNSFPRNGRTAPDVVLGQADMQGDKPNGGGPVSASGLNIPNGITVENGRLAVVDQGNNRVLIWNQIPNQNNQPADLCLGQPNCTTNTVGTSATRLRNPTGAQFSQGTLYLADASNHRVLVFPDTSTQAAAATIALGQPTLLTGAVNIGGQSASTLATPFSVKVDSGRVVVADAGNHRVLIWNTLPTKSGEAADVVVGQLDFSNSYPRPDRHLLESPSDVAIVSNHLYVSSSTQARVLYWSQIPTENGVPADRVLGQPDFVTARVNNPDVPPLERTNVPFGLTTHGTQLLVIDNQYDRLLLRPLFE